MRTARVVIVWVLLPLAITGALVLSASATIDFAVASGVSPSLAPAAVAMLEFLSLAGTGLWIFVTGNVSLRREAIASTLGACCVSIVAGVYAYGALGVIGPLGLIGVAHLASRVWREADNEPQIDTEAISQEIGVPVAPPVDTRTYVYRILSSEGDLLYVGATVNLELRLGVHRRQKPWWPEAAEVSTEQYPDRASALAVEQSAIANENPRYNQRPGALRDAHGGSAGAVERLAFSVAPRSADEPEPGTVLELVRQREQEDSLLVRARELVAAGAGRPTLKRELDVTDHRARQLLAEVRQA